MEPPSQRTPFAPKNKFLLRNAKNAGTGKATWLKRAASKLYERLHPGPDSREEFAHTIALAGERRVIDAQSQQMIEGVMRLDGRVAGDVMVATQQVQMLDIQAPLEDLMGLVIDTAHSRFPVYDSAAETPDDSQPREHIIGVLHAKDLLKLHRAPDLNVRTLLRPAVFIPENKRLLDLLKEFKNSRQHMAMVIDEFGHLAGMVTVEDVLEEIVGEIADEFDNPDQDAQTLAGKIFALGGGAYRVSGDTALALLAEQLQLPLNRAAVEAFDHFDTIAGLVAHELGHVPQKGESLKLAGAQFTALHSKSGQVKWFKVMV